MPCHHGSTWKPSNMTRAILASVVPGAVGLICYKPFYGQKRAIDFWNSSKKPNWAPKSLRFYACVDALTISPIGYASYLVYEHGGGFANRNTAISLGLYGGSLAFGLASIPFMNRKDLESMFYISIAIHLTAAGAALTAFKINHAAGVLMVPYVLWTGFCTGLLYAMGKMNCKKN